MKRMEIEERVRQLLKEYLNLQNPENISVHEDLIAYGLDSMKAIQFSLELEENFNVEYDTEELAYQNFNNIKTIADFIEKKVK